MNLSNEFKQILDKQQNEVINSSEDKILVAAGPGSGKTHTLVQRIKKDIVCIDDWEGIIACSFAKEASRQLERKLSKEIELKQSFIGTIDALVLSTIFNPYKNRYIKLLGGKGHIAKLKVRFSEQKSSASNVAKMGKNCLAYERSSCLNAWKRGFCDGTYEISFAPYVLALDLFERIPEAKDYFKRLFKIIYIDEAQDLNSFQISFIKYLSFDLGLKCVLVGDKNQSIYAFRGAKPDEFYQLTNGGFKEYKISISVRCHPSILSFANRFIGEESSLLSVTDNRVHLEFDFTKKESFESLVGSFFILFETNEDAIKCYDYLSSRNYLAKPIVYSRPIEIDDKTFKSYYVEIIEEILKFFFNYDNEDRSFIYPLEEFRLFLSNFLDERRLRDDTLLGVKAKPYEYVLSILSLFEERIADTIVMNIRRELDDECVINHYKRSNSINRIMTIHASKGLEADNVIVRIKGNSRRVDNEYKRKMYVAFTRAKENLFISTASVGQAVIELINDAYYYSQLIAS